MNQMMGIMMKIIAMTCYVKVNLNMLNIMVTCLTKKGACASIITLCGSNDKLHNNVVLHTKYFKGHSCCDAYSHKTHACDRMIKVEDYDFHDHNLLELYLNPEVVNSDPGAIIYSDAIGVHFPNDAHHFSHREISFLCDVRCREIVFLKKTEILTRTSENKAYTAKISEMLACSDERLQELRGEKEDLTAYQQLDRSRRLVACPSMIRNLDDLGN